MGWEGGVFLVGRGDHGVGPGFFFSIPKQKKNGGGRGLRGGGIYVTAPGQHFLQLA